MLDGRTGGRVGRGFGRFVKADDTTKAMKDLCAFRCQSSLDSLHEIPQNLSIVFGEEIFAVMVHLESWERLPGDNGVGPPAPPRKGPENEIQDPEARRDDAQGNEGRDRNDEEMAEGAGELEDAESVRSATREHRALTALSPAVSLTSPTMYGRVTALPPGGTSVDGGDGQRLRFNTKNVDAIPEASTGKTEVATCRRAAIRCGAKP